MYRKLTLDSLKRELRHLYNTFLYAGTAAKPVILQVITGNASLLQVLDNYFLPIPVQLHTPCFLFS